MPYNFLCVQAGCLLSELSSASDVFSLQTTLKLTAGAVVTLVPGLLLQRYQQRQRQSLLVDSKTDWKVVASCHLVNLHYTKGVMIKSFSQSWLTAVLGALWTKKPNFKTKLCLSHDVIYGDGRVGHVSHHGSKQQTVTALILQICNSVTAECLINACFQINTIF